MSLYCTYIAKWYYLYYYLFNPNGTIFNFYEMKLKYTLIRLCTMRHAKVCAAVLFFFADCLRYRTAGHRKVALFLRWVLERSLLSECLILTHGSINKNQSLSEQAFRNPSKKKYCNLSVTDYSVTQAICIACISESTYT